MLKIEFETDNAAFGDGNATYETARILRNIADRIKGGATEGGAYDFNGNHVGKWSVSFWASDYLEGEE